MACNCGKSKKTVKKTTPKTNSLITLKTASKPTKRVASNSGPITIGRGKFSPK